MSKYELAQTFIRAMPLLILLPAYIFLLRTKWYWRFCAMFVLAWVVIAISTLLFWQYSIEYAPTEEIRTGLAMKDGGPLLFGTMFGWAFGLVYLVVFEISNVVYVLLSRVFAKAEPKNA